MRSFDTTDIRWRPDTESLLLLPPGHKLNRIAPYQGTPRAPQRSRLRSGRPRTRRTKRASSSRGDPDPGEPGEQPALPVTRKGSTMKRGGAL